MDQKTKNKLKRKMRQFKKNQLRQEDCSARLLPLVARILYPDLFEHKSPCGGTPRRKLFLAGEQRRPRCRTVRLSPHTVVRSLLLRLDLCDGQPRRPADLHPQRTENQGTSNRGVHRQQPEAGQIHSPTFLHHFHLGSPNCRDSARTQSVGCFRGFGFPGKPGSVVHHFPDCDNPVDRHFDCFLLRAAVLLPLLVPDRRHPQPGIPAAHADNQETKRELPQLQPLHAKLPHVHPALQNG